MKFHLRLLSRMLFSLLAVWIASTPSVYAQGGQQDGSGDKPATRAAGPVTRMAEGQLFDLVLRCLNPSPGQPADFRLTLADYATNLPAADVQIEAEVVNADIKVTDWKMTQPGVYEARFNIPKAEKFNVFFILRKGEESDLVEVENIPVAPEEDAARNVSVAEREDWKKAIPIFGLGLAAGLIISTLIAMFLVSSRRGSPPPHEIPNPAAVGEPASPSPSEKPKDGEEETARKPQTQETKS